MSLFKPLCFPEKLTVRILEQQTLQPVEGIAVTLHLHARYKNDYDFMPPLSDENGKIQIRREWMKECVREVTAIFMMDYSSGLEDCHAKIRLELMGHSDIERAIAARHTFSMLHLPNNYIVPITDLEGAANRDYQPRAYEYIFATPEIEERRITIQAQRRQK